MRFLFIKICVFFMVLFLGSVVDVQALTLSPTKQTVIVDPGSSQIVKITLKNDQEQTLIATGEIDGFRIDESTNRALFGVRDDSLDWVRITPAQVSLAPGETKDISFLIQVPKDVKTGVHYLGLFASVAPEKAQVGIASRVGSLLFLYTSGTVTEASHVVDFSSGNDWYKNNLAHIFVQLQNTGNIHVLPEGGIQVKNWRGKTIAHFLLNSENRFLFPDLTVDKHFEVSFTPKDIGKIKARLHYVYGVGKHSEVKDIEFWYIPTWFLGFVGMMIVFVVSGIIFVISRTFGIKR